MLPRYESTARKKWKWSASCYEQAVTILVGTRGDGAQLETRNEDKHHFAGADKCWATGACGVSEVSERARCPDASPPGGSCGEIEGDRCCSDARPPAGS